MDLARVLADFDAEVRAQPMAPTGLTVERDGGVVRLTGAFNFVSWWNFDTRPAKEAVAEQAALFTVRRERLLWRVYDYDRPEGLGGILEAAGFRPQPRGTLMLFDVSQTLPFTAPDLLTIRRVRTLADVDDYARAQDLALGEGQGSRVRDTYANGLGDENRALYLACWDGEPVASARLETEPGRRFGYLYGGGVTPKHRGRGIYRALVAARVDEAQRRGVTWLATEARDTSRPILERLGFAPATRETTWVLDPPV